MSTTISTVVSKPPVIAGRTGSAFTVAWILLAVEAAVFLYVIFQVWMSLPEMNDRFLIPIAAAWLLKRNYPQWQATPTRPSILGLILVALGAILAPPAWFLLVQVGPRVILLWWLLAAIVVAALGLLATQFGWRRAWQCAFPLGFCFLALPTPVVLQTPLQMRLKEYTTSAAAWALPAIGIPAERRGHVLDLRSGELGVVDACSGVRSVTALTAIALFVAYVRGFSIVRGAILVLITMGIVVVSNSIRVIVTGILQESVGPKFTHGLAHDVLGYLVILVGLAMIVGVSSLLAPRNRLPEPITGPTLTTTPARGGLIAAVLLAVSLGGCFWSEQFRSAHRQAVDLDRLPAVVDGWEGRDDPVSEAVADMLKCDQMVHRIYRGPLGHDIELYLMFWATPASTAHMHNPDVCMPCQGWTIESSRVREVPYAPDRAALPVSIRTYSQKDRRHLVFYWTQTGNSIMPDGPQDPRQVSEYAWIRKLLTGDAAISRTSRLSVRLDIPLSGSASHQEEVVAAVCAAMAREVYRLCPWAEPK
jgi:EpsI family protein